MPVYFYILSTYTAYDTTSAVGEHQETSSDFLQLDIDQYERIGQEIPGQSRTVALDQSTADAMNHYQQLEERHSSTNNNAIYTGLHTNSNDYYNLRNNGHAV